MQTFGVPDGRITPTQGLGSTMDGALVDDGFQGTLDEPVKETIVSIYHLLKIVARSLSIDVAACT